MGNARDITLDIIGRDQTKAATSSAAGNLETLRRKMDDAGKSSKSFGQKFKGGVSAAAPYAKAAGLALIGLAGASIKAASDAEQSIGASQTVFGKYADVIIGKSKGAAEAYGLSADDYRNSANLIGSLFKNQGVAVDQLAGKTDKMIGLGTDLAATFGGTTADAVEALGSAFKGEFDPLERYGISLSQSKVNAYLAAHGQDKLKGSAMAAAKQQAIAALVTDQSKDSLGAFAREGETTAHKQQVLQAKVKDLGVAFGIKLLPYVNKALDFLTKFGDWAKKHPSVIMAVAAAVGVLAGAIVIMNLAFLASPFGLITLAIAALAAAFVYGWTKSQKFREVVVGVFAAVAGAVLTNVGVILRVFKVMAMAWLDAVGIIIHGAAKAFGWVPGVGDKLKGASKAFDGFKAGVSKSLDAAIKKTDDWKAAVSKMPKEVKLKGEISDLKAKIDAGIKKVATLKGEKRVRAIADIAQLQQKLNEAQGKINALHGKTVTVTVKLKGDKVGGLGSGGGGGGGSWSAGSSFESLEGGTGVSRTGGPAAQRMADIHLDGSTNVFLDGALIQSIARREVVSATGRQAWRARTGRR